MFNVDNPECELPRQRAIFNMIPRLLHALSKNDRYDQVLILDADSLIVDLDFDITGLLSDEQMLAANRANQDDVLRSWNVNNGIALWNLHHNTTKRVAQRWISQLSRGVKAYLSGVTMHGDQHYFHKALIEEAGASSAVKALDSEFRYEKGTVVKHFVRRNHNNWSDNGKDERKSKIINAVEKVCLDFPVECEALEHVPYATV